MLKELFYYLYHYLKKYKYVSQPAMSAFGYVVVLIVLNIQAIANIILNYFNTTTSQLLGRHGVIIVIIFGVLIMFILSPIYLNRDIVFNKYDSIPDTIKQKRKPFFKLYIFLSFLVLIISIVLSRSISDRINSKNELNQEIKVKISDIDSIKLDPAKSYY